MEKKKKKKRKKNGRCAMIVREVAYSVLGCSLTRESRARREEERANANGVIYVYFRIWYIFIWKP